MQRTFYGVGAGEWKVIRSTTLCGEPLPEVSHLTTTETAAASWSLSGVVAERVYATAEEDARLRALSPELGRPQDTRGAFIALRKSAQWWSLSHNKRRRIFEEQSRHMRIGEGYLPAVARQIFHSRALGEPFDFLSWFEFAPQFEGAFDELVDKLRRSREWAYVEREVELRLIRVES